jgi:hypothetical protein
MIGPNMDPTGLTYRLSFLTLLPGTRIASVEDAEELHAEIYRENLVIANSIRCIRPFLGEFPLTPGFVA